MKVGDTLVCKDEEDLKRNMLALLRKGYVIKVEFDKMRITINEVPEDDE